MKTLIQDGEYQTLVDVFKSDKHTNKTCVRFSSKWEHAKNPGEERVKMEMYLTQKEIKDLITALQQTHRTPDLFDMH